MPGSQGSQPGKPRKTAGNGAGRGSAVQNGGRVFPSPPTGSAQDIHRTPPHSVEAEQGVLGSMLISKDAIADVAEVLRGVDFYRPTHETIHDSIIDLYGRGEPVDMVTVAAE